MQRLLIGDSMFKDAMSQLAQGQAVLQIKHNSRYQGMNLRLILELLWLVLVD